MTPTTEEVRALLARLLRMADADYGSVYFDRTTLRDGCREAAALCESWLAREGAVGQPIEQQWACTPYWRDANSYPDAAPREAQDDQLYPPAPDATDGWPDPQPGSDDELVAQLSADYKTHDWRRCHVASLRLAAQAQEIAELRAELKDAQWWTSAWKHRAELSEAALAEARQDAERYRWLRDEVNGGNEAHADVYIRCEEDNWDEVQITRGSTLDAAIDAARTAIARGEVSTPPASA